MKSGDPELTSWEKQCLELCTFGPFACLHPLTSGAALPQVLKASEPVC